MSIETRAVKRLPRCASCRMMISKGIPVTTMNRGERRARFAHADCIEHLREQMGVPYVGASVCFFVLEREMGNAWNTKLAKQGQAAKGEG